MKGAAMDQTHPMMSFRCMCAIGMLLKNEVVCSLYLGMLFAMGWLPHPARPFDELDS
jgi:hypothetical protein